MKKVVQILSIVSLVAIPILVLANGGASGTKVLIPGTCEWYCEDIETRDPPEGAFCICNPIDADSFEEIINNIVDFIYTISLAIVPLMIVWAGVLYVTSGGDPKKVETAKNIILYTLAGFAVILLSKGFIAIIEQLLE